MRYLTMLLIAVMLGAACTNQIQQNTPNTATLSGIIQNTSDDKVVISGFGLNESISLEDDGTFSTTISLEDATYLKFKHNNEYTDFYLKPGDDLHLSIDVIAFDESIKYSGIGEKENNYIAQKFLLAENNYGAHDTATFLMDETTFLDNANAMKSEFLAVLDNRSGLNKTFVEREKKYVEFDHIDMVDNYSFMHGWFTKNMEFKASDDFPKPTENLAMNNEEYYRLYSTYREFVWMDCKIRTGWKPDINLLLDTIKTYKSELIQNHLIKRTARLEAGDKEGATKVYEAIMTVLTDEKIKDHFTEKYDFLFKLSEGEPSPTFTYNTIEGVPVSLESLTGKLVYIDVWATWCMPCRKEIPHLKMLEASYHNEAIEFVSISVDKDTDHDKWIKMVQEKELGGIQLIADKAFKSDFIKEYVIDGIPRFILLDQEGKIISEDAPRPSSDTTIRNLIDEYLDINNQLSSLH